MRIGADVDPHWDPHLLSTRALFHSEPNLPSTRNALQNTFSRAPFHKRWWINDPDCLMIRPDSDLTLAEVESLATTIALTGGSLFFSDDLTKLPTERLRIAESLLPLIGKSSRVLDWFDASAPHLLRLDLNNQTGQWHLLAVFNWDDVPRDMNLSLVNVDLPPGDYYAREFWSGTTRRIVDGALELPGIPPHGVQLLSLRSLIPDQAHFLGSDLHISQGLEVTAWRPSLDNGIHLQLNRPGRVNGVIDLHLPGSPTIVNLNQEGVQWRLLDGRFYRFPVVFDQRAEIEIVWNNS
jgi:alpha-galactosidase